MPSQEATNIKVIKKIFASQIKEVSEKDRTLQFTITAETQDRDGEVVKADGGQFDNYNKNPVVLWAHDYKALPVGKTTKLERLNSAIVSTVQFPTKEEYEYADTVYKLCKGGYLNAVSIGFIPIEVVKGKTDKDPSRIFTKWEMLGYSIVPVPSNPNALKNAVSAGLITAKEFKGLAEDIANAPIIDLTRHEKPYSQDEIKDEVDYLIAMLKDASLNDENKILLKELSGAIEKIIPPVKIEIQVNTDALQAATLPVQISTESIEEYIQKSIKKKLTEVIK